MLRHITKHLNSGGGDVGTLLYIDVWKGATGRTVGGSGGARKKTERGK